jgi:hypothetical protein
MRWLRTEALYPLSYVSQKKTLMVAAEGVAPSSTGI